MKWIYIRNQSVQWIWGTTGSRTFKCYKNLPCWYIGGEWNTLVHKGERRRASDILPLGRSGSTWSTEPWVATLHVSMHVIYFPYLQQIYLWYCKEVVMWEFPHWTLTSRHCLNSWELELSLWLACGTFSVWAPTWQLNWMSLCSQESFSPSRHQRAEPKPRHVTQLENLFKWKWEMKELFAAFTRNSPLAPLWPLCVPAIQLGSSSSGLPQGTLPEPEAQVCYLGLHLLAQSGDCLALSATQLQSTVGSHVWWCDIFFSFQALPGNQVLWGLQIHGVMKTWYTEIRNPVTRNPCAALCKSLIKPSPPLLLS